MTKEWEKPEDLRRRKPVLWLTMTALFMAMVVVLSMSALSIPVPGGHLYFNDVVIDTAAMLMDPRRRLSRAAWVRFWATCCSIPRRCSCRLLRTACRRSLSPCSAGSCA